MGILDNIGSHKINCKNTMTNSDARAQGLQLLVQAAKNIYEAKLSYYQTSEMTPIGLVKRIALIVFLTLTCVQLFMQASAIPSPPGRVTISIRGEGTTIPSPGEYWGFDAVTVYAIPDTHNGWKFSHWIRPDREYYSNPITVDLGSAWSPKYSTLKAVFIESPPDMQILSIRIDNWRASPGTTNPLPSDHLYSVGEVAHVEAFASPKWKLDHWILDGLILNPDDPSHAHVNVTMDSHRVLSAVFRKSSYDLAVRAAPFLEGVPFAANGVLYATPQWYWYETFDIGSSVTLVMPESHDGYVWSRWLQDGDTNRIETVTMDRDIELAAVFTLPPPPSIFILSPENKTYATSPVSLSLNIDEPTSWIGYSLDGQANLTILGNTTISDLSDGTHSLIVYAKDAAENIGTSEIIYFSVETPSPEPEALWVLTIIVMMISAIGIFTAVYFTKAKKTKSLKSS